MARRLGDAFHLVRDAIHVRDRDRVARHLFGGRARQPLGHLGDAGGRRLHAVGRLGDAADRGPQAFDHRGDGARHVAELVLAIAADAHREIALPDALRDLLDLEDRLHEPSREEHARAEGGREREHAGEQQIAVGARDRLALGHQRKDHAHLERAERARHRLDVLARGRAGRARRSPRRRTARTTP